MTMHVYWDNEYKTILRCESEGRWTWEEYHQALNQVVDMIESVPHRVDLMNVPRRGAVTPSGSAMPHFQRALRILPSNTGLNVIVNTNAFGRAIISMFSKLYGRHTGGNIAAVGTLEEAYALIARTRAGVGR